MNDRRTPVLRQPPATTICLCWLHPLLLSDCRRLLSGNGFRLRDSRLQPEVFSDGEAFPLPKASVYIVEANANFALTQNVICRILSRRPGASVLVVAERFDQKSAFTLLRLGVKGLLSYREAPRLLRRAVKEIARKGCWVSRSLLSDFLDSASRGLHPLPPHRLRGEARLSRREHEVSELLLENLSNRQIADRLAVSERTAKFHVSNLLAKYGLKRRADLVVLGYSQMQAMGGGARNGDAKRAAAVRRA